MKWLLLPLLLVPVLPACATGQEPDCGNPVTTYDMNICGAREVERAEAELDRYFKAGRERLRDDAEALAALDKAQAAWMAYRDSHCDAVYAMHRGGTIRGPLAVACRLAVVRARTHELWSTYLTYPDSTPPVLPEPK